MTVPTSPRTVLANPRTVLANPCHRALTLLAALIFGLAGLFLIPAGAADAHAALISTNPVAGSVIPTAPSEIVITFSEHVGPVAAKISVIGPDRKKIDSGPPVSVGDELRIPVDSKVPTGTYLVSYRVISADSHPVANGFYYSVGAPSPGGAPKALTGDGTDPVVATAVSIFQFVGFAGLCLVIGPTLVLIALWPRRLDRRAPSKVVFTGLGAIAVATVAGLYLQAPYGSGTGIFDVSGSDFSNEIDTTFGRALMVRLAVLVICALLLRPVLAGRSVKSDRVLLGIVGVIGVATWAFEGHPAASSVPPLTIIADVAHLASVAIWLGGLVMLVGFLLRKANARELGALLPVWSNWATLAIAVLVLGGTASALIEIGSISALLHTTYGQLVIVKVGILAVILLFAAGARKLVQRHGGLVTAGVVTVGETEGDDTEGDDTDGDDPERADAEPSGMFEPQVKRLRRSVLAELILAVLVLVASSILVQSSPAQNAAGVNAGSDGSLSLTSPLYTLQVEFLPSGGGTDIHMFVFNAAGGPQPVQEMTVVATLPAESLTENLGVSRITDTHWTTTAVLPVPGKWTFTFTLRTTAIDEASVHTTVNIN